jgi:Rrf2 family nitric oxide-sensitive transcriptional repressor
MLTETSVAAIRVLVHLALEAEDAPVSARQCAAELGLSPSYMAKIIHLLTRAGLLNAHRGVRGGATLAVKPSRIRLADVVEVCQSPILADYCTPGAHLGQVCAFHRAMAELHDALTSVLSRWTVADLAAKPAPSPALARKVDCRLGLP